MELRKHINIYFRKLIQQVSVWLIPYTCILCLDNTDSELDLCSACILDLPWLKNECSSCALPIDSSIEHSSKLPCGNCLKNPPPYNKIISLFIYQSPIDSFITALKFQGTLRYASMIGKLMATHLEQYYQHQPKPACIIPVPLHQNRLKERGFNQAQEIALPIAKKLNIPLEIYSCIRHRATEPQTLIDTPVRRKNLRNAFSIIKTINATYVAIIDDVVTTGSTVTELCLALKKAGVQKIDIWCCARSIKTFK